MRVNKNSLCKRIKDGDALEYFKQFSKKHLNDYYTKYEPTIRNLSPGHSDFARHMDQFGANQARVNFWEQTGFRTLVFSDPAAQSLDDYKVPKEVRVDVIKTLPSRKDIIQVKEGLCIRYTKDDKRLSAAFCYEGEEMQPDGTIAKGINVYFFTIDLENDIVIFDPHPEFSKKGSTHDEYVEHFYGTFMVIITYLELTGISSEVIEGGRSSSGTKKTEKVKNDTSDRIIFVKKNWSVEKIRLDGFKVRGHWRLQPYGVGRAHYRYVWINTYEKGMMIRMPQKLIAK